MNEKKRPPEIAWVDDDGDRLRASVPSEMPPTRPAAYVTASEPGVYLTAAQCRDVAAHLTALADYHEEAMVRRARELPTKPGAIIIPADGREHVEAMANVAWYANEAVLGPDNRWHGVWRADSGLAISSVSPGEITPGTWKVDDQ